MGGKRYSAFISPPCLFERYLTILSLAIPNMTTPARQPMPMPRYVRPTDPCEKPYCSSYTSVMVVNRRYRYPYTTAMYVDSASTIGEKMRNFMGRTMESLNSADGVKVDFNFDCSRSFPVSFRRRLALRSRRIGGYVSRRKKRAEMENTPPCRNISKAVLMEKRTIEY